MQDKVTILHVTNWFPSKIKPHKGKWIYSQISSLNNYFNNEIVHIEVIPGKFDYKISKISNMIYSFIFIFPYKRWFINEILTAILFMMVVYKKHKVNNYCLINIHIAYPLLIYFKFFKYFFNVPIVINEHWSAYHYKFNLTNKKKIKKIAQIFKNGIPIITVSKALMNDINKFSKISNTFHIVPNAINTDIFYNFNHSRIEYQFFMCSLWQYPKNPFPIIHLIAKLNVILPKLKLHIGGYGDQTSEMNSLISFLKLNDNITLLGELTSNQIAEQLNQSSAFIHSSDYETFSTVCAESLCCGTPVISSNVGGIKEYITPECGIMINNNKINEFETAIKFVINNSNYYNYNKISDYGINKFSLSSVGKIYSKTIHKYI